MTIAVSIICSIIAALITTEFLARGTRLSGALIRVASRRLPRKYRERFFEEWSADMRDQPTVAAQLLFSVGLLLAAEQISVRERRLTARLRATRSKKAALSAKERHIQRRLDEGRAALLGDVALSERFRVQTELSEEELARIFELAGVVVPSSDEIAQAIKVAAKRRLERGD